MRNRFGFAGVALAGALAGGISAAVGYFAGRRAAERALREWRREIQQQFDLLTARLDAAGVPAAAELDRAWPKPAAVAAQAETSAVSADTVALIAAAVTTFLGKKVRVRSARKLQTPYEIVDPWTQQGRVVVQASHNVVQRQRR